jgi:MFS family permease
VLLAGNGIVIVSVLWTVGTGSTVGFMLAFGLLLSVGLAFVSPVSLTPVISHWFTRRRGMALFFLSTGSMAGMAVMTPVLSVAIEAFGWRSTLVGFAAAFTLFTLPGALFVIHDQAPEHTDLTPDDFAAQRARAGSQAPSLKLREAMRTAPFWKIFFGLFACGFSMNLLGTHGMPMLMDHGFDAFTSSMGIGLIGFVAIGGTLVLGRMADRLPRRNILATIYFVRGLGFFALVVVGTHWELYATAAIGGLVWAGSIALSSAILPTSTACAGGRALRHGLPRPPDRRDAQLLAGRLGLRALRHALDRVRRLGRAADRRRRRGAAACRARASR